MTSTKNQQSSDSDYHASDDQLTAEFRHCIGLLSEEEDNLSDVFKQRLGLKALTPEEQLNEVEVLTLPNSSYEIERDATINRIKFEKFIKSAYQPDSPSAFTNSPLTQPLLAKDNDVDRLASLVISIAIKTLCGDISTPASASKPTVRVPMVKTVLSLLDLYSKNAESTSSASLPAASSTANSKRQSFKKLFSGNSSTTNGSETQPIVALGVSLDSSLVSSIPTTELELVQFIVAHGILRKELRDEIYCQLSAQVTGNPSAESTELGWTLHVLCAGCFLPSRKLLPSYFGFLNDMTSLASQWVNQIKRVIHQTSEKGPRYYPPSTLELQAVKSRTSVTLPVLLSDGRCEMIETDASTTSGEMCRKIATSIGLQDQFGFAIFISVNDKVSSLGQGSDHVMDAITECEQLVLEKHSTAVESIGETTGSRTAAAAVWQLFYLKEIFTPWHDVSYDDTATQIIYKQIVNSVMAGDFHLRSEDEAVRFIARRWYIENGDKPLPGSIFSSLNQLLPKSMLSVAASKTSRDSWTRAILASFDQMGLAAKKHSRRQVMWAIVNSAKRKWPQHFSALFAVTCVHGPSLPRTDVVFAISCRGVFLLEKPHKVLFQMYYYELVEANFIRSLNGCGPPGFTIRKVTGEQMTFRSPNSVTITRLVTGFLDGLRRRSRWAIAIEEFLLQDHTKQTVGGRQGNVFELRHGDVVELMDETTQESLKDHWMYGRQVRTGACGAFPYDCVYVIPTRERPPDDFLGIFGNLSCSFVDRLPRKRGVVVLASETIGRHAGGRGRHSLI